MNAQLIGYLGGTRIDERTGLRIRRFHQVNKGKYTPDPDGKAYKESKKKS